MNRQHPTQRLLQSRRARAEMRARARALGGALSIGSMLVPGGIQAALVTISGPSSGVAVSTGEAVLVTDTGVITDAGDGVRNAAPNSTIGDSPAQVGILNQGEINGGVDGIAVKTGSTLNGSIVNEGAILAGEDGVDVTGNSVVTGDIVNEGSIAASNEGVRVLASTVAGDVLNSGAIGTEDIPIGIDGIGVTDSTVEGGISNSGSIAASRDGVLVGDAVVRGAIQNTSDGVIRAERNGIAIVSSSGVVQGGVVNDGSIRAGVDGLYIGSSGTLQGGLTNRGSITGGCGGCGGGGILVASSGSIEGGIRNESGGVIDGSGADHGILFASDASLSGGITNAGRISGGSGGVVFAARSTLTGGVTNTGSIFGEEVAILITSSSTLAGAVTNSGTLDGAVALAGSDGAGGGIDLFNEGLTNLRDGLSIITGDFTQTGTGALAMTVFNIATQPPPLIIVGDAELDGALSVSFTENFFPNGEFRFTLLGILGNRNGFFANAADGAIVGRVGRRDIVIDYADNGDVELFAVPLPAPLLLIGIGVFGLAAVRSGLPPGRV